MGAGSWALSAPQYISTFLACSHWPEIPTWYYAVTGNSSISGIRADQLMYARRRAHVGVPTVTQCCSAYIALAAKVMRRARAVFEQGV